MYQVNLWVTHPDLENDDCVTGAGFDSKAEALEVFHNPQNFFKVSSFNCTEYVEIDGPDINEVRKNQNYIPEKDDHASWNREIAMQAGMAGGCEAYNDTYGW